MKENDENFWELYAELLSQTFKKEITKEHLKKKHKENPLGMSIVAKAMDGDKLAGARAFWYMFYEDGNVYQPCDTVTDTSYRRQGIFTKLTLACLSQLNDNDYVLNFPNNNSLSGYLNLGWGLYSENKKRFSLSVFPKKKQAYTKCLFDGVNNGSLETFLNWRFSEMKPNNYVFYTTNTNLIIQCQSQSGAINLSGRSNFYGNNFSWGYSIANNKIVQGLSIFLSCQSRTVFYPNNLATKVKISRLLSKLDVNLLMDTF